MQAVSLFPCLSHHIGRIIETGNVRLRHSLINRHGQNPFSHRHFQQLAGEMLRNTGHCLFQIGVVFRLVHCPHQAAHRFPLRVEQCDHAVIKNCFRPSFGTHREWLLFVPWPSLRVSIITRPFPVSSLQKIHDLCEVLLRFLKDRQHTVAMHHLRAGGHRIGDICPFAGFLKSPAMRRRAPRPAE